MTDLTLTRIGLAEHEYPTPTRNILSEQQRERAKRASAPKGSEVRYGYRAKDGTNYMFPTQSERDAARKADNANRMLAKQQRNEALMKQLNESMARIDSWASHA